MTLNVPEKLGSYLQDNGHSSGYLEPPPVKLHTFSLPGHLVRMPAAGTNWKDSFWPVLWQRLWGFILFPFSDVRPVWQEVSDH